MSEKHPFDLQGHRGARGLFPENTLEGFEGALRLGLRSFEIDIAVTRDGVPVVHHDPALNPDLARGPDGAWIVRRRLLRDLALDELAQFDVGRIRPGSEYARRYATQTPYDGARIPTLDAVLRFHPAARFNIELKLVPDHPDWTVPPEEMVERVLSAVDGAGAVERITIQSFDWRAPRHVRRTRPKVARGWLTETRTIRDATLWRGDERAANTLEAVPDAIAAEGGGTWTPHHAELTQALLDRAHDLGLRVVPWTVNDAADMARLVGWGVDGLITDWPDRAGQLAGADRTVT